MKTKQELAEAIKEATQALNQLSMEADEMGLLVTMKQQWHPMSNAHDRKENNPPISVTITESVTY